MVQAQSLTEDARDVADLSVGQRYFGGEPIERVDNRWDWGFDPDASGDLTRLSYVFQAVYSREDDYGGIQLRARVHTYGPPRGELRSALKETAHRAAHMYNSPIETRAYINTDGLRGGAGGVGYLDGFQAVGVYSNWEQEEIPHNRQQTDLGVVDWSVEVYEEDDFDENASLAGIAQGVSYPYGVSYDESPGRQAVDIAPHEWGIAGPHDSRPDYYELRPPARTNARDRYRDGAGRGKRVYINGEYVGETDNKGRVWLKKEYARGDGHSYGEKYSRKGLVEETGATYQAIRDGGTLYATGETEARIDLVTAREKPDDYRAADPDSVPVDQEVQSGEVGSTEANLYVEPPEMPLACECRRDEAVPWALGRSNPEYEHSIDVDQRYEPSLGGDPNDYGWGGKGGDE